MKPFFRSHILRFAILLLRADRPHRDSTKTTEANHSPTKHCVILFFFTLPPVPVQYMSHDLKVTTFFLAKFWGPLPPESMWFWTESSEGSREPFLMCPGALKNTWFDLSAKKKVFQKSFFFVTFFSLEDFCVPVSLYFSKGTQTRFRPKIKIFVYFRVLEGS